MNSEEQVERVVAKTLREKLHAATHWSRRTMTKATGLSRSVVVRIWQVLRLQPNRRENFKSSTEL